MRRELAIAWGLGIAGLATWSILAAADYMVMPSYLAAWLCWMALPLGALPIVMLLELMGVTAWTVLPLLRRLLLLAPIGALLAVPIMLKTPGLYDPHMVATQLPPAYAAPWDRVLRMIVMLATWSVLALIFCRAPRGEPRRGWAALGLMIHLAAGTLAAVDWVLSIDPGLASSAFGLLVISGQAGLALCFATFVLSVTSKGPLPREAPPLMAGVLGCWIFLQFLQFLVVWSANLPDEVTWYLKRTQGIGGPAIWCMAAAAVLGVAALLPYRLVRLPWVMASVAAMLLLMHLTGIFWLVTPAYRGAFVIGAADLPALIGFGGVAVGLLSLTARFARRREMHAAT